MVERLYLCENSLYVQTDAFKRQPSEYNERTGIYLVVAQSASEAIEKFNAYFVIDVRKRDWNIPRIKELSAGTDIPLEKRVEILAEVFPIIV